MAEKTKVIIVPHEERANFKALLLANPDWAFNPGKAKLPSVFLNNSTFYEKLSAVGYDPGTHLLEGTFGVNNAFGYNGGLCSGGSFEYVRFYLDFGAGWEDQGLVGVNVHDIPTEKDCSGKPKKPISYTAKIKIDASAHRRGCSTPVIPKIRAILSWEVAPPANSPNWKPFWGNVEDCYIQIEARWFFSLPEFWKDKILVLAEQQPHLGIQQIAQNLMLAEPAFAEALSKPATTEAIAKSYIAAKVDATRFHAADIKNALVSNNLSVLSNVTALTKSPFKVNISDVLKKYFATKANVAYEELESIGLDHSQEFLTASVHVKRPFGYSGDLCSDMFPHFGGGSYEYVSFWADWDDTCRWEYLGTASVKVHDLGRVPEEGVCYAAYLPYDFNRHRQVCDKPKVVKIRSVLSWNTPPSTTDPNDLETYGNVKETYIQIKPGANTGQVRPVITNLGGIPVSEINSATGLTIPTAKFADTGIPVDPRGCPFSGLVTIEGLAFAGNKYRIQYRPQGEANWITLFTPIEVVQWNGVTTVRVPHVPDPAGYFDYLSYLQNLESTLGWLNTPAGETRPYEIKLDILGLAGTDNKKVQIDNVAPTLALNITNMGGNCADYTTGTKIMGNFTAVDTYFKSYQFGLSAAGGAFTPVSGSTPVVNGNWELDTAGLTPCGYTVTLYVSDRVIINSSYEGRTVSTPVSFCLRAKTS